MSTVAEFPKLTSSLDPRKICEEYHTAREKLSRLDGIRSAWAFIFGGIIGGSIVAFSNEYWAVGVAFWCIVSALVFKLERWKDQRAQLQIKVDKCIINLFSLLESLPYHYETANTLSQLLSGRVLEKSQWALVDDAVCFLQSRLDIEHAKNKEREFKAEIVNLFEASRRK